MRSKAQNGIPHLQLSEDSFHSTVLEKLLISQLFNKSPYFMEPLLHKSLPLVSILSQINPVYSMPIFQRSILILYSSLYLGFSSALSVSDSRTKILDVLLFSHIRATRQDHLILLDLITNTPQWGVSVMKILTMQLSLSFSYFLVLNPTQILSNLIPNTHSPSTSLRVTLSFTPI